MKPGQGNDQPRHFRTVNEKKRNINSAALVNLLEY
jgi:hypothetical protein